jgi:Lon-like protease
VSQDEPPGRIGAGDAVATEEPGDSASSGAAPPPPPWTLTPPVRRRAWPWILGVVCCLLVVASVVASFVQLPYYTISPGDALDVNRLVSVHGARQYPPKGAVMLLFIRQRSNINAWRWLQASLDSDIDMIKKRDYLGNVDPAELDAAAVRDMTESQNQAKAVALRRLGYKVTLLDRVNVYAVVSGRPASGVLQPGDTILAVDGKSVTTPEALVKAVHKRRPGDRISIRYLRDGRQSVASIRAAADQDGHAVLGIFLGQPYKFPFDVRIDTSDIGGPSAGLAMTLSILDELTPGDLTGGERVAVTGEIESNGAVGEVGGVGQKAVAARHRGAQLFLVPKGEVAEARSRAGSLRVVGVRTLADALAALRAAGGDALPPVRSGTAA